ncbi:anthranilate phosphoribosyltransferase [Candidatus Nitrososphaera gargensis Ga9.2]|uniref:Anthranilate phosphoribosyltransferase n=1 Tax=Nitrososphaera gargensis (strain Ga9.2) TaxID=1237085 RepID=K0II35_NITGG|nr:anthranilate phosphoribosyltransferase [Candidatus Nitrososphaera gargensis]AFU58603.1 anthranilate phosphoribosyltransferase [Candidatus Nitrososphaera gargensis Ga9.2]
MSAQQPDLRPAIRKLVARTNLSDKEVSLALDAILSGSIPDAAISAFLVAFAMKGETAEELGSVLCSLQNHATKITPNVQGPLIDTCGTGGDSIRSFNISTAAAIVASAAGAKVAKHGNRSVSGLSGSADFFEYVGLDLNAPPAKVQSCIESTRIGFMFAPLFHPSMKHVAAARKAIGIRTVFNMVGPLSNPCTNISGQVIGVFEPTLLDVFAQVCQGRINEAMIVHAHDGFDELSNTCENDVLWVSGDRQTKRIRLHPRAVGMKVAKPEQLVVNSKEESIRSTLQSIYGKASKEKQDIVVLNAAAALVVSKIAHDFKDGVEIAGDAIKSGKAQDKLLQMIKYCGDIEKLKEAEKKFL